MKNEEIIKKFLERESAKSGLRTITNGIYQYQGRTLQTDGNKLINYSTIIAYFYNDTLRLNTKKYSQTTSKIQNTIKRLASDMGLSITEYVGE